MRRDLKKEIGQYPDLFNKIKEYGMRVVYNVKLKYYVMSTELIRLAKLKEWRMYLGSNANADMDDIFCIVDVRKECQVLWGVISQYWSWLCEFSGT